MAKGVQGASRRTPEAWHTRSGHQQGAVEREVGRHMTDLFEPHKHRHNRDPDTSHAAAEQATSFVGKHRAQVYAAIRHRPMASEQISRETGLTYMQVQRRVSDLHNDGRIEDSGRRHRNSSGRQAVVWQLAGAPPLFQAPKPKRKTAEQIHDDALEEAACICQDFAYARLNTGADVWLQKAAAAIRGQKKARPKPG